MPEFQRTDFGFLIEEFASLTHLHMQSEVGFDPVVHLFLILKHGPPFAKPLNEITRSLNISQVDLLCNVEPRKSWE